MTTPGAFAIVPCNDLEAALPFWEKMGFARTGGDANYFILTGWECEVHLRRGDPPPWDVPENNPFGVFIRTPHVDEIARLMDDLPAGELLTQPTQCPLRRTARRIFAAPPL